MFAVPAGGNPAEVLVRFDTAPTYVASTIRALRDAGVRVIPTGGNADHYDVQLIDRVGENEDRAFPEVKMAAARMLAAAGPLRPNPAYSGVAPMTPEDPR